MASGGGMSKRATPTGVVVVLIVVAITLWNQRHGVTGGGSGAGASGRGPSAGSPGPVPARAGASGEIAPKKAEGCAGEIKRAIEERRSDLMVECSGEIIKVLEDDTEAPRHQRFLVRLENGSVIKLAHNVDLAARVPARTGDRVEFAGEFDWNENGGAVHWTHLDPRGKHPAGWVRFAGKLYQ